MWNQVSNEVFYLITGPLCWYQRSEVNQKGEQEKVYVTAPIPGLTSKVHRVGNRWKSDSCFHSKTLFEKRIRKGKHELNHVLHQASDDILQFITRFALWDLEPSIRDLQKAIHKSLLFPSSWFPTKQSTRGIICYEKDLVTEKIQIFLNSSSTQWLIQRLLPGVPPVLFGAGLEAEHLAFAFNQLIGKKHPWKIQ